MALLSRGGMNATVVEHMQNRIKVVTTFAIPPGIAYLLLHRSVEWWDLQPGTIDKTPVAKAGVPAIPEKVARYRISP